MINDIKQIRILGAAMVALLAVLAFGCHSYSPPPWPAGATEPHEPGTASYSTNLLQEGDVIAVTLEYTTNLNTVQKIALDGTLNLQSAGPVKAAGKTPDQLQKEVLAIYKPQVKDDTVTVKLVSTVSSIYISGAVYRPGKIALERPMTVLEAIMEAGGYDLERAKLSDVSVLRVEAGHQQRYSVDIDRVLSGKVTQPFYLRPFDIVHVPARKFNF